MKKRWITGILTLAMLLATALNGPCALGEEDAAATEAPAQPPIAQGVGWTLSADGWMTVTPEARLSYNNRADVEWYDYMNRIYGLRVGEGVTELGPYVFCDAENLARVELPEGLRTIDVRAFSHCERLQALTLPDSLASIGYWAFAGCNRVEQIVVGSEAMSQLNNYAFQNSQGLLRAVIRDPIKRLGYDALEDCVALRELYLPASLELIDKAALHNCPALTDIYYGGSEAKWQSVRVEERNEETLRQVTVHFDSPWDPDAAPHVSTLRAKTDKSDWVQMWGAFQIYYSGWDYYAMLKGNLEGKDWLLAAAGVDRSTIETFLEENHDECLFIPRGQSYYDVDCYCVTKAGTTDFAADDTLERLLREHPDDATAYLDRLSEHMGLGEPVGFEDHGGMTFAVYHHDTGHVFVTVQNGHAFTLHFIAFSGYEAERDAMEADIMQAVCIYTPEPEPTEQPEAAPPSGQSYSFMDGRLTVNLDPAVYDVFLQDNAENEAVLERQGLTRDKMDAYMQGVDYQLMAVPAGTPFLESDWRFLLHIKAPKYKGIRNLKDFSETEKRLLIDTIVRSFHVSDWQLVHTDAVDYFVFEALGSVRYATIVDERMIYLYIKAENGQVTDAHREALRAIMEGVRWNLG
ncbi:MAG: leucine-rich repeat domain-containing protein [Eubacteriales bacterium]